jgi:hypothetical protein
MKKDLGKVSTKQKTEVELILFSKTVSPVVEMLRRVGIASIKFSV